MFIFKENKVLSIWFLIAVCLTVWGFYTPNINSSETINTKDTLIYFSYKQEQKDEFDAKFKSLYNKNSFNGVVLIGQKDSIFYQGIYGYANFSNRDSLDNNSSFQLASVSKQFTAVAILQLYEKGLLKLNDSIQKFIPDFPYRNVTIHQLLTHRSGLPNYHYFFQHIPTTADTLISNMDLVSEMVEKKPKAYYPPNRRYHYSNTGYALLAAIVEIVSGESFTNYLHNNIFEPLNMVNAFAYRGSDNKKNNNKTTGYLKRRKPAEDNYLDGVLGDKGIYCSAEDLFKWDQGLYNNIIINADTLKQAFEPMGKPYYFKSNYGYGWRMFNWNDSTKILFHAGWWHGYRSLLLRIPNDTATIVILKNKSSGSQISTKSLLNIFYPKSQPDSSIMSQDSILL